MTPPTAQAAVPVVLLPGMLCDDELWDGIREAVAAPGGHRPRSHPRASGARGHRLVDVPLSADSIEGMAEQVLAAVDGPFVVIGLSLGAIVGFELLRRAPERVAAFMACSTNAGAPRPDQLRSWREMAAATRAGRFEHVIREDVLPGMFRSSSPAPRERKSFLRMARRTGTERFLTQLAAQSTRTDALPHIAAYDGPVLVVSGGRDALCPPDFHRAIAHAAPRSLSYELPDAGHLLPLEQPAELTDLLRRWLPAAVTVRPTAARHDPDLRP